MYDADLQMRFMRSATNAFFEGADAMMAASRAWQDAVLSSTGAKAAPTAKLIAPMPAEPFAAWSWAFDLWRDQPAVAPAMKAALAWQGANTAKLGWPMQPFQMASPLTSLPWAMPTPAPFGAPSAMLSADPAAFWSSMISAYWTLPAVSWPLYQGPMTMMLVGAGLPYAIAAPTARASAAALDAADAVRLQAINTFSSFQTAGGHASAQLFPAPLQIAAPDSAKKRAATRRLSRH